MDDNKHKLSAKKVKFLGEHFNMTDSEILKEILFAQQSQIVKLEKIRGNTSMLVWWLVAIPIIVGLCFMFFGGCTAL